MGTALWGSKGVSNSFGQGRVQNPAREVVSFIAEVTRRLRKACKKEIPRSRTETDMSRRTTTRRNRKKHRPVKIAKPRRIAIGRPIVLIVLCALLVAGVVSRVYFLDRSVWLDEAWVANSLQAESLREALYYDDWLQTSPPLFIVLGRFSTYLFGASNVALRALPAFAGIIAVVFLSFLALRLLKPSFALLALLLFVFSPRAILYSQSVKQYSTDILSTIGLLALGHVYLEKYSDRSFYWLLAGVAVLSFLSYPAMLFFPFVLFCALARGDSYPQVNDMRKKLRLNWPRGVLVVATAALVAASNYWFFIAPNKNSALTEFFQEGFYQGSTAVELLVFYGTRLSTLTEVFFFGGPGPLRILALLITVFGFFCLWAPPKNSSNVKTFHTAVLFTAPVVGVVVLNMLGVFPLPGFQHRVLLFEFPVTVLVFCLGLQMVGNLTARVLAARTGGLRATFVENAFGTIVFLAMAGLVWLFVSTVGLAPFFAEEHEDSEEAVAYLRQRARADDVLYVHATMREQFKLYTRAQPVPASSVIYGMIGMPCCPRRNYRSPQQESEKDVTDEIVALSNAANGRRLWVLITNRGLHWFHVRRNDIDIFERGLAREGCQKRGEEKFTGVYVAGFGCAQK